jgi:hypothetical protein
VFDALRTEFSAKILKLFMKQNICWTIAGLSTLLLCLSLYFFPFTGKAFVIHSSIEAQISLQGYCGLSEIPLYKGKVRFADPIEIETAYRGLALLLINGNYQYPIIIKDSSLAFTIVSPYLPPSFSGDGENYYFYSLLSGNEHLVQKFTYAHLLLQAKNLLESSQSIKSMADLQKKKNEFLTFLGKNYVYLKNSDRIKRLLTQYFMMLEYVDFHAAGAPATDIGRRYEAEVMEGVRNWLDVLGSHVPQYEILNFCVSLYYDRSMVTLASKIIMKFKESAFCPGVADTPETFPEDLTLVVPSTKNQKKLNETKGNKIMAFVSDDCPVSMVETVMKARSAAQGKDQTIVAIPLQQLNENHMSMRRMVSGGNMLFVDDEKWRKENFPEKLRLPMFVQMKDEQVVEFAD